MVSRTAPTFAASLHCPAVTTKDNGDPCPSTQKWILLVRPPRECPSHSSVTSPFFRRGKRLQDARSTSLRLHVRRIKRSTIPIDTAGRIGSHLHDLEKTMPCAGARPANEPVVAGLPRAVARRNVALGRAGPQSLQDSIDHMPMLDIRMAVTWIGWQMWFQLPPLLFS